MKIYITRHGQVDLNAEYFNGDVTLPKGEVAISELGKQQATLLGKRMKELGFRGKILSSPLLRTMETAELVARETGSVIIPTPWFHEIFWNPEEIKIYRGYNVKELKSFFPHVDENAVMEEVWWATQVETNEMVYERVAKGIEKYLKEGDEDILLVGHGASSGAAHDYLKLRDGGFIWNCCIGLYDTVNPEHNYGNDISYLPKHMVSTNKVMGMDIDFNDKFGKLYPIELPGELREEKNVKLLHIGDTHSVTYPYYKQIIKMVKPDIIVHTGDTADEVKVERIPGTKGEYLEKIQELLDILEEAKCKIFWIPGNNDLPEEIAKRAPFIEIVQPDTVLDIQGVDICMTHSREQITKDAEIYLYGHGRRAANDIIEKSMGKTDALYLNVMWNSYVLTLPEKKLYEFERPEFRDGVWKRGVDGK